MTSIPLHHRTRRTGAPGSGSGSATRSALPAVVVGLALSLVGYAALAVLLVVVAARALA